MTEAAYEQGVLNLAVLYWLHDNRRLPVQSLMCAQGLTVQKPFIASQVYNIMLHTTWHKFSHAHCRTELGVRTCATLSLRRGPGTILEPYTFCAIGPGCIAAENGSPSDGTW